MDKSLAILFNTLGRRLISLLVNRGIDHIAGKGKPAAQMTKAERAQAHNAKSLAKRAKDIAAVARKIR